MARDRASGRLSRRVLLQGAAAVGATGIAAGSALAQQARRAPPAATRSATTRSAGAPTGGLPPRREFVIRGANVLTMDAGLGDFTTGDVHVRDGAIIAVGRVNAPNTLPSIDARGMICMPGFVDTHWHMWTGLLRPFVKSDVAELGYFPVSGRLGQLMTPEDSQRSVRLSAAQALGAGVTTVQNWSHNTRSPDHADGELAAMRDTGLRGRFAYGTPQGMADEEPMDIAGLARVKRDWMTGDRTSGDGLLTLGMCSRNIGAMSIGGGVRGSVTIEMAKKDWGATRELGLPITLHTSGPSPITALEQAGLLGPDVQLVHALLTTPEERAILKARGVSYSIAAIGEAKRHASLGEIQLGELLADGVKISMSTDQATNTACDPFVAMRLLFALHEHRIGSARIPLTMKRLVQLATLDGAVDLGLANTTGSLTPGKRADIILVRTTDINMTPANDPYEALVSLGQPGNVDSVIVDGRVLRRDGKFVTLDHAKVVREAQEAGAALRARAKWPA